jgi:hypothetical protein
VDIQVGANKCNFTVHRDLLNFYSSYFQSALGGSCKESEENLIILPEDDPDVFELFVHWLYAQRFRQTDVTGLKTSRNMARLYVFADMRGVLGLKDIVITGFVQHLKKGTLPVKHSLLREIPYIYANTAEKSLLRKLVVDYIAYDTAQEIKLGGFKEYLTAEFLLEVTLKMKESPKLLHAPYKINTCTYHEHETGPPCDA